MHRSPTNLLLILADQHRADILPSRGAPVRAPNLAALARESVDFTRCYCAQPVCTPSRGSILTGLWPHHHGAVLNNVALSPRARTLAEHAPSTHATAYIGKWHLGRELHAQHGFREWKSIEDEYLAQDGDQALRSDYHRFLVANGFPPDRPDGTFSRAFAAALPAPLTKASFVAGEAERFLQERRDGQPFVLTVGFLEPHPPTFGPYNQLHDPAALPVGPSFGRPVPPDASRHHRRRAERVRDEGFKQHPLDDEQDWRRLRANYYGLVTLVDEAVGRVLRALEASGQAERTVVVYTSDHGDMLGDHGLVQKGVLYEEATRVPLLMRCPGMTPRVEPTLFSQVDLAPTLTGLLEWPGGQFDGASRAAALSRRDTAEADEIVIVWKDRKDADEDARCIVTRDGFKCAFYRGDSPELYDLNDDPHELRNLGGSRSHASRIADCAGRVRAWQSRVGDELQLTTA